MTSTRPSAVVLTDDQDALIIIGQTLREAGFAVRLADDEGSAAELIAAEPIDLAVIPTLLRGDWVRRVRRMRPALKFLYIADTPACGPEHIGESSALIFQPIEPLRLLSRAYQLVLGGGAIGDLRQNLWEEVVLIPIVPAKTIG